MKNGGRCSCGRVHPSPAEQELCRRRAACREAGRALTFCLVFAEECRERGVRPPPARLAEPPAALALPGRKPNPWRESLVWFGGGAAEDLLFGERLQPGPHSQEDWRRAERCLRSIGRYELARDAFLMVRDLLEHHRRALDAVVQALEMQGELAGEQVWNLVEDNPPQRP